MAAERHDYVYMGGDRDTVPPEATHVSVNESVTVIPARLFQRHGNIVELICHIGVTKIEAFAFERCFLLERVIMPGVVEVELAAFYYCHRLHTINCERLEIIGESAFKWAEFESIDLPSARIVEGGAFQECGLKDVKFSKNLESIVFFGCESLGQVFLVEGTIDDALIDAVGSLILPDEWKNHIVNEEVNLINQFLPSVLAGEWDEDRHRRDHEKGGKGKLIREWITRAKQKIIDEYKEEYCLLLSLAAVELAHASPHEIVIDSVLSFLQLPDHEFEDEGENSFTPPTFDRQMWKNVVQMKQRLLEKDAEIASLKQRVAQFELQSTEESGELKKNDTGWPEKRQRSS